MNKTTKALERMIQWIPRSTISASDEVVFLNHCRKNLPAICDRYQKLEAALQRIVEYLPCPPMDHDDVLCNDIVEKALAFDPLDDIERLRKAKEYAAIAEAYYEGLYPTE